MCRSDADGFNYTRGINGSIDIYTQLRSSGYKILKYSGDADGAVPTYGTQQWIRNLNWNVTTPWAPYFYNGQVSGYYEVRENLFTFASVHGAGHMVPSTKRPQAYNLIYNWINNKPLA
jgi:carboxypeptidase C (cathepsin A)